MIRNGIAATGLLAVVVIGASALVLAAQDSDSQIAQGKYLVERVAICTNCHGPGLQGAAVEFRPIRKIPNWSDKTPGIAGLRGWSRPAAVKFLSTGVTPDGKRPNPPMLPYRLNAGDAEAVVAYLKSLQVAK